jgi:hypothetical protein
MPSWSTHSSIPLQRDGSLSVTEMFASFEAIIVEQYVALVERSPYSYNSAVLSE